MALEPHQQRVVQEKKELDVKRDRLTEFLKSATFPHLNDGEKERLTRQSRIMDEYSGVLAERIANF